MRLLLPTFTDEVFELIAADDVRRLVYVLAYSTLDYRWCIYRFMMPVEERHVLSAMQTVAALSLFPPGLLPICAAFVGCKAECLVRIRLGTDFRFSEETCPSDMIVDHPTGDLWMLIPDNQIYRVYTGSCTTDIVEIKAAIYEFRGWGCSICGGSGCSRCAVAYYEPPRLTQDPTGRVFTVDGIEFVQNGIAKPAPWKTTAYFSLWSAAFSIPRPEEKTMPLTPSSGFVPKSWACETCTFQNVDGLQQKNIDTVKSNEICFSIKGDLPRQRLQSYIRLPREPHKGSRVGFACVNCMDTARVLDSVDCVTVLRLEMDRVLVLTTEARTLWIAPISAFGSIQKPIRALESVSERIATLPEGAKGIRAAAHWVLWIVCKEGIYGLDV